MLSLTRLCFAGARNNHYPRMFKLIQTRFHTPIICVIFEVGVPQELILFQENENMFKVLKFVDKNYIQDSK